MFTPSHPRARHTGRTHPGFEAAEGQVGEGRRGRAGAGGQAQGQSYRNLPAHTTILSSVHSFVHSFIHPVCQALLGLWDPTCAATSEKEALGQCRSDD